MSPLQPQRFRLDVPDAVLGTCGTGSRVPIRHWQTEETGYSHIQGTRPQTPAYALTDSPAGLAAWIAERFYVWTDHADGDTAPPIDIDSSSPTSRSTG